MNQADMSGPVIAGAAFPCERLGRRLGGSADPDVAVEHCGKTETMKQSTTKEEEVESSTIYNFII